MLKAHLELILVVADEPSVNLRKDPTPGLLLSWKDPEHRLQALTVKFALASKLAADFEFAPAR